MEEFGGRLLEGYQPEVRLPGTRSPPSPYLYVGPWESRRPGDPGSWNAPFGAVLTYEDLRGMNDPATVAVAFFLKGIALLGTHES